MIYKVEKVDGTGRTFDYGTMDEEDMKAVTRGYKKEEGFTNLYTRKGSQTIYIVEEV